MKDHITVRVNSLTIEKHSYRADGGEQGKIGFEQVEGGPFESLYFSASLRPGAPIPYQLGDRLVMTIERPDLPTAPPQPVDELRDEAVGLGVADRAAQDLIADDLATVVR